jgi:hypothetical protein
MPTHTHKTPISAAQHKARLDELLVALGSTNEIAPIDHDLFGEKIAEAITQATSLPSSKRNSQRRALNRQRDRA